MPTFEVRDPSGNVYEIEGPEGSTQEDAIREVQRQLASQQDTPAPAEDPSQARLLSFGYTSVQSDVDDIAQIAERKFKKTGKTFDPRLGDLFKGILSGDFSSFTSKLQNPLERTSPEEEEGIRRQQELEKENRLKETFPEIVGTEWENHPTVRLGQIARFLSTPSTALPIGAPAKLTKGIVAAKKAGKPIAGKVAGASALSGAATGAFAAGEIALDNIAREGEVDPDQLAWGSAIGLAIGAAIPAVGAKLTRKGRGPAKEPSIVEAPAKGELGRGGKPGFEEQFRQTIDSKFDHIQQEATRIHKQITDRQLMLQSAFPNLSKQESLQRAIRDVKELGFRAPAVGEKLFEDVATQEKNLTQFTKRQAKSIAKERIKNETYDPNTGRLSNLFKSFSESMYAVSPRLGRKFANWESSVHVKIADKLQGMRVMSGKSGDFHNSLAARAWARLTSQDAKELHKAMANAPFDLSMERRIDELVENHPDLKAAVNAWRNYRQHFKQRLLAAGYKNIRFLDNYYPVVWTDEGGKAAFFAKQDKSLRNIKDALGEAAENDPLFGLGPRFNRQLLRRKFDVDPFGKVRQLKPRKRAVYEDADIPNMENPLLSIRRYTQDLEEALSKREAFGFSLNPKNAGKSIGDFVIKEFQKGKLSQQDINRVSDLLSARFITGPQHMGKVATGIRNTITSILLGTPKAALIQIADAASSVAANGAWNTVKSFASNMVGQKAFTKADIGVLDIVTELGKTGSHSPLRKGIGNKLKLWEQDTVDFWLRVGGFKNIDKWGKDVFINASLRKLQRIAKTDPERLIEKYRGYFTPQETREFILELRKSNRRIKQNQNNLVRQALFTELAGWQPIDLSGMPVSWLKNPKFRLAYQLSTFMIKQNEAARRLFAEQWRAGHGGKAALELGRYVMALTFLTGSVETARRLVFGQVSPEELQPGHPVMSGAEVLMSISTFGRVNKFGVDRLWDGDPTALALGMFGPFPGMLVGASKDAVGIARGDDPVARTLKYLPFVSAGKEYVEFEDEEGQDGLEQEILDLLEF